MIIRANNKEINVKSILGDFLKRNGKTYPALRFEFDNEATAEDVQALMSGSFEILDDNGEVMGTHEGYNTLKSVSVVVGKITTDEQKIEKLEAEKSVLAASLAQSEATNAELTTTLETTQAEKEELQNAVDVIVGGGTETEPEPEVEDGGNV
jgi:hypothetical protein